MEPVSLIVGALLAGAASGGQETVSQAVKDAYAGLKALVTRRFAEQHQPEAPGVLVRVEDQAARSGVEQVSAGWRTVLEEEIERSGAGTDEAVLGAAQQLMALLDDAGTRAGKYVVTNVNSPGAITGDYNTITQTIGHPANPQPPRP